jgi:hypothetical protein
MKAIPYLPTVCSFAWASVLLLPLSVAWGYRSFVSTDAVVADLEEMGDRARLLQFGTRQAYQKRI